jgi:hypothetical protein
VGNTVRDAGTNFLSVEAWTSDNADRLSHGRLRRLLANESRLRRPERRRCVLTVPTSLEISPQFSAAAAADGRVAEATVEVFHVVSLRLQSLEREPILNVTHVAVNSVAECRAHSAFTAAHGS